MTVKFHGYKLPVLKNLQLLRQRRRPRIVEKKNCTCFNLEEAQGDGYQFYGGLYDKNGDYIVESGLITNNNAVLTGRDGISKAEPAYHLSGKCLYLGVSHLHYGHFILETLSRLCLFSSIDLRQFNHVLVLPSQGNILPQFAIDLFKSLGIFKKIHIVTEVCSIESVTIPEPAVIYPSSVHTSVNGLHKLFGDRGGTRLSDQPLYISRDKSAPGFTRSIIGDELIQYNLEKQGAYIFYPEEHSVIDQIKIFHRHKTIIGFAGSALHTLLLSGGQKKVLAYSDRDVPRVFPLIDVALKNTAHYIKARYRLKGDLFSPDIGFKPQIIDPFPVLQCLKNEGIIAHVDTNGFTKDQFNKSIVVKNNTAKILRLIVQKATYDDFDACTELWRSYRAHYDLDVDMVNYALQCSPLIQKAVDMRVYE